jgi:hypothetical protein
MTGDGTTPFAAQCIPKTRSTSATRSPVSTLVVALVFMFFRDLGQFALDSGQISVTDVDLIDCLLRLASEPFPCTMLSLPFSVSHLVCKSLSL